nr:hypothetical protein [Tanacetum cinerariifolium]
NGDEKNDETDYKRLQQQIFPSFSSFSFIASAAPLAVLTIMKETLTVKDEEPLNSARDVRKVMQVIWQQNLVATPTASSPYRCFAKEVVPKSLTCCGCVIDRVTKRFLALGWHFEEIHMTWAHLEKKRTRLRTCTKIHQEVLFSERGDGVASIKRRRRDLSGDGVWILATASQRSQLKVNLEPSTW